MAGLIGALQIATSIASLARVAKTANKETTDMRYHPNPNGRIDIGSALVRQPAPPARRAGGQRTPLRLQKLPNGSYVASVQLPGGAKVVACVPGRLLERYVTVGGDTAFVGISGIFDDIARGISTVMRSDVVQTVAATGLALYGVPPGVTKGVLEQGGRLVGKAAAGEPRARARVAEITSRAARGDRVARTAAQVLTATQRATRDARGAMDLLHKAQQGNARARQRVQQIEQAAARGAPPARRAQRAMQEVIRASAQTRAGAQPPPPSRRAGRQPPPPVVRRGSQPPPPAARAPGRVVRVRQLPNGQREVVMHMGGPALDWLKRQFGFYRGYRPEADVFGLRDAYRAGLGV